MNSHVVFTVGVVSPVFIYNMVKENTWSSILLCCGPFLNKKKANNTKLKTNLTVQAVWFFLILSEKLKRPTSLVHFGGGRSKAFLLSFFLLHF